MQDPEAAIHMFRIYNDWLVDFCSHYQASIGLACLPYGDIPAAVDEIHRCAKMGLRGLETVLLLGHGADVASMLGSALGSGQRG